ncbi:unnamed protein product [Parajaminaea phylloscopi]
MVLKAYESFLLANASQITAVESTLRSLTYFLPGRFKDAEVAAEAIYSAINLLGMYHDDILNRLVVHRDVSQTGAAPPPPPSSAPLSVSSSQQIGNAGSSTSLDANAEASTSVPLLPYNPSQHARYTNFYSDKSTTYRVAARLLVVIGYTELMSEMVARKRLGKKAAWDVVLGIEALKAALRLVLYHITSSRLTIQPPIAEREVDPEMLQNQRNEILFAQLERRRNLDPSPSQQQALLPSSAAESGATPSSSTTWTGSRTGYTRPTLASLRQRTLRTDADGPSRSASRSSSRPRSTSRILSRSHTSEDGDDDDDYSSDSSDDSSEGTLVDPVTGKDTAQRTALEPWTDATINEYLTSKALSKHDVLRPPQLVRPLNLSKRAVLSEYLYILRPLLYVLAIRKWGARRWEGWVISLGTEYASHLLRSSAYASSRKLVSASAASSEGSAGLLNPMLLTLLSTSHPLLRFGAHLAQHSLPSPKAASQVEEAEWSHRRRAFLWYLLRGPLWHSYTRPRVQSLCKSLEGRMLLGALGAMVSDYVPLVDELHFYVN